MDEYLVITTLTDGGNVRDVKRFDSEEEAIDHVLGVADEDGYLSRGDAEEVKADRLRKLLRREGTYEDGGFRLTIYNTLS